MNERIKQIASDTDVWCDQHWAGSEFYDVQWEQKYAELIVQDLIDSMIKRYGDDDDLPIQEIEFFVKEHFGVKE